MTKPTPKLSIIVNFHNMRREAERTLYTLSSQYQTGVDADDWEVIAIDNGSSEPLNPEDVTKFGHNFSYHFFPTDSISPAAAVNYGVQMARGEFISCIVDGARMVTPGLISNAFKAFKIFETPFVCALAFHLGPKVQKFSMLDGYNQDQEDRLLETIDWRSNGYELFDVATIAPVSRCGFLGGLPPECSWFAMQKKTYLNLGGMDERFKNAGGGRLNFDFLERVVGTKGIEILVLLGEGSFHQIHGGATTNVPPDQHPRPANLAEYHAIHGREYEKFAQPKIFYLGNMPRSAMRFISKA
jgi:glycosyltransferase involved in cell wall biosynthesis